MSNMLRNLTIKSLLLILLFTFPSMSLAQSRSTDAKSLHQKIDKLSQMLTELKTEQDRSQSIRTEIETPNSGFTKRDSLRLLALRRKQAESSAMIDALTEDIIKISKELEDPRKRYALAKRMQATREPETVLVDSAVSKKHTISEAISARSIDLAAVKLVRQGNSLDQARLLTIDQLSDDQVLAFYRGLAKVDRYELYDIADEISISEKVDPIKARRSAIYFYLYTR